jgi:hypothetical protein
MRLGSAIGFASPTGGGVMQKDRMMRWIVLLFTSVLVSLNALAADPIANDQTNNTVVLSFRQLISLGYSDPDGGNMTFTLLGAPANGTLEWSNAGNYEALTVGAPVAASTWYYSTTETNAGTDSFTWRVSDGTATSRAATVTINLTSNCAPVAVCTTQGIAIASVRCFMNLNVSHPDSQQTRTYTFTTLPVNGFIEHAISGQPPWGIVQSNTPVVGNLMYFYYTATNATGTEYYSWHVGDGIATSKTVTNRINITGNSVPIANNQAYSMAVGAVRYYLGLSSSHPDYWQNQKWQLLAPPARGLLEYQSGTNWVSITDNMVVDTGNWLYTSLGTSTGTDSFTWRMNDGLSTSGIATVSITLVANTPPTANAQSVNLLVNTVQKYLYPSVTHSDFYQAISYIITDLPTNGILQYLDGTNYVSIPQDTPITQSQWFYTPLANYVGRDSIRWKVSDGLSTSSVATCTLNVTGNRVPVAKDIRMIGLPDSGLTVSPSYTDPDVGQTWTASVVGNAMHGNVTVELGNKFTYAPNPGFKGIDGFTYKVNDSTDDSNIATVTIQIRDANDHASNLVLVVVNDTIRPVISNEIDRLKADIEADGYTAKIKDWHLSGSTSSNLWKYLKGEYDNTSQFLEGAILIGDVPKAQTYAYHASYNGYKWFYTDLVYWNMAEYQTNGEIIARHIWVTRMNADDTQRGAQDVLLRRALDANHYYRRGMSRLPSNAYVFDCFNASPNTNTMLEVWPRVFGGGGGGLDPTFKFAPSRTDIDHAACDCFVLGGEVFNETSHGTADDYMWDRRFDKSALYRLIAQQRAGFFCSCTSGAFGGIVNNHIFTRGGGMVLAVGGTDINYNGDFIINETGNYQFRARLKAGDSWGGACLYSYPFTTTGSRTVFYGDLSMRVMASASNEVPVVTNLQAVPASPKTGQPVTFAITISDPDGNGAKSPYLPFRNQVEWFMNGYNYGQNNPTYTANDFGHAGWTNQTHVFAAAGVYNVRVEVMDEWRAIGWKEMTVTVTDPIVTCAITSPTNGAAVYGGTNTPITVSATTTYGTITNVDFYVDGAKIVSVTNAPFTCEWTATVVGSRVLSAKAVASQGTTANAAAVSVRVLANPDANSNGLPDAWETQYFGNTNTAKGAPTADADGDGLSNLQEYQAGTDPTNRLSVLCVSALEFYSPSSEFVIRWQSATGKTYSIHCSTNLVTDSFTNLVIGDVPAHLPENVYTDAVPRPDTVFYRIKLDQ